MLRLWPTSSTTLSLKQWDVMREFRRRSENRFDMEGIEMPFPQHTLWIGGGMWGSVLPVLGSIRVVWHEVFQHDQA